MILNKDFDEINKDDILELINNNVRESLTLDYKREYKLDYSTYEMEKKEKEAKEKEAKIKMLQLWQILKVAT